MSIKSQSKRMRFSNKMRVARIVRRITKANSGKPGFVGVALNMKIDGKYYGHGALFVGEGDGQ